VRDWAREGPGWWGMWAGVLWGLLLESLSCWSFEWPWELRKEHGPLHPGQVHSFISLLLFNLWPPEFVTD
jgi:hypothetical protein